MRGPTSFPSAVQDALMLRVQLLRIDARIGRRAWLRWSRLLEGEGRYPREKFFRMTVNSLPASG